MRLLLAAAGLVAALVGRAGDIPVSWDADLAPPADPAAYERQLRAIVSDSRARVAAEIGIEPGPLLSVKIHSRAGYQRQFGAGAAHLDAARFAGEVVHVNGGARLDDRFAGVVVHEMVHAALDARGTARALPRTGELSRQGYLGAWAAVVFLDGRFGRERVMAMVRATLGGATFEKALRREMSLSPEDLDAAFEAWVGGL